MAPQSWKRWEQEGAEDRSVFSHRRCKKLTLVIGNETAYLSIRVNGIFSNCVLEEWKKEEGGFDEEEFIRDVVPLAADRIRAFLRKYRIPENSKNCKFCNTPNEKLGYQYLTKEAALWTYEHWRDNHWTLT